MKRTNQHNTRNVMNYCSNKTKAQVNILCQTSL
uniref:Uncharacterized protein n=1 Tax=Lepeophtheirus salmonis TaxID=72036 RepID=A0A0K2TV17_LEPSM